MQKVVAINLNGRAYHVEEPGYAALLTYLDRAGVRLAENPDRAEILADLEQAIAEKCDRGLGPHKSVVTAGEIDRIVTEMGPVDAGDDAGDAPKPGAKATAASVDSPKRLYRIREGAMITGLCAGIAAYLNVDVTIVRAVFVLLAFLTKGAWLVVYAVLVFLIPYAETSEDRAAARGRPFTAQELIDQAMRNIADLKTSENWKRQWRRQQRAWRRATAPHGWNSSASYAAHVWTRATAPVFGLISAALALALVFALVSLATSQTVYGVSLPDGMPLWAGFVIVFGLYQLVAMPFAAVHRAAIQTNTPGALVWLSPVSNLVWLAAVGFCIWYGYHHVPAVHDAIDVALRTLGDVADDLRER